MPNVHRLYKPASPIILDDRQKLQEYCSFWGRQQLHCMLYFYSMDKCIRTFLNIPDIFPIYLFPPHGIHLEDDYRHAPEFFEGPCLVSRSAELRWVPEAEKDRTYILGCPYAHYRRILGIERSDTPSFNLYFPGHSSNVLTAQHDWGEIVKKVKEIEQIHGETWMCLYFLDALRAPLEYLKEAGIRLLTLGHYWDPHFVDRLYNVLSDCRTLFTDATGSYIQYAVELGVPVSMVGQPVAFNPEEEHEWLMEEKLNRLEKIQTRKQAIFRLCTFEPDEPIVIRDEMLQMTRFLMGSDDEIDFPRLRRAVMTSALRHPELAIKSTRTFRWLRQKIQAKNG